MAGFNYVLFALCLVSCNAAPSKNLVSKVQVPEECKGKQFCSIKPEGYHLLEEEMNNALPEALLKDYAERSGSETPSEEPELSPKEDWHNCPYMKKTQSMFMYNYGGNETKFDIFVQTNLFKQYVEMVTCATDHIDAASDEQCFQGLGVAAFHMKSTCVSSMAKRTLYVYDTEKKKIIQKYFEVPACCTCKVSYNI